MGTTTITILCENTAGNRFGVLGEHGFAALIERPGLRLLFDTGGGHTLVNNAARIGQDLRRLDAVAISHGHHDHTGGLFDLLVLQEGELPAYVHPEVFAEKYSAHKTEGGVQKHTYIGMPHTRAAYESVGARFVVGRAPRQIAEGVWLSGEVPRRTPFERVPARLQLRQDGRYAHDEMRDEQSLYLRGGQGLIVVMGCAHPGIVNTIEHAREVTGIAEVEAVVGGTHLVGADAGQVEATIAALRQLQPQLIGTAHCTGMKANARIAVEFGEAFKACSAGTVLELA